MKNIAFWAFKALTADIPVGRFRGVPIKVSVLLVAGLIATARFSIDRLLLLTFVVLSVLAHELGHTIMAQRLGCAVHGIRLEIIGGIATMEFPTRWRDELIIALAGPVVSAVLFVSLFAVYRMTSIELVRHIGVTNLMLATFNMLPAFPLDGGRVLRALLARRRNALQATEIAVRVSRFVVVAMFSLVAFGAYTVVIIAGLLWLAGSAELRNERTKADGE